MSPRVSRQTGRASVASPAGPARPVPAAPGAGRSAWPSGLLAGAFFLSGASALIYEILWFRLLGHIFGSTATAASTLLAAYLFGLGLGAWIFGRISDRVGRLPMLYACVEAAIGVYGIASHFLLERGAALYASTYDWASVSGGRLLFTRFALSFLLIVIPTTLMGGTFPLMVQMLKGARVDVGRATGRAYAINTAGAAWGTLGLPAFLLPGFGVTYSLAIAALSNFGAAALVAFEARKTIEPRALPSSAPGSAPAPAPAPAEGPARSGKSANGLLLIAFFLSSFASIALENVWTRHLSFFFGAQTWTFAFVLFAYLVGLFLGGAAYARFSGVVRPETLLGRGLLIAAVGVAVPIPFLGYVAIPQIKMMLVLGISNGTFLFTTGLLTIGLVLVPAFGFGLVFPSVVDLLARSGRRTGASVGLTYVVNTAGTTLGALGAGFWLVPRYGSQRTLELMVLLIGVALALSAPIAAKQREARAARAPGRRDGEVPGTEGARGAIRYAALGGFLVLLILPRWNWAFAHAQYAKDPLSFLEKYQNGSLWRIIANYKIPYLKEGTEATVSICEFGGGLRSLYVNGKPDASNIPDDMVAQRLLACVPALFHPDPRKALVIGVGSGTTVATLGRFPVESIDAAEISPEVGDAAKTFFTDVNEGFLTNPRVVMRLDDGRNFLHFRPSNTYDIIISEPSNPWMAGVSALFTDEFFADVHDKLRPGGIFCQWFHYYNMSMDHIRLLARTFHQRFPDSALFVIRGTRPTGDILVIGSKGPMRLARTPEDPSLPADVRAALVEVGNGTTQQILSGLVAGPGDFQAFGGHGALNVDDLPVLEFEAPADRFGTDFYGNLSSLLTSFEKTFLPAGPALDASPAPLEAARDGFEMPRGVPAGAETRRGFLVLTHFRTGGDDLARWALAGREFEDAGSTTGLYRLARTLARPDEHVDIASALAGAGVVSRDEQLVNGHSGIRVVAESAGRRTVVIGWSCPVQNRAFFVFKSAPATGDAGDAAAVADDLAARFPCRHSPTQPPSIRLPSPRTQETPKIRSR